MTKYVFHLKGTSQMKKVKRVTFNNKSEYISLNYLIDVENQYLTRYHDFLGFPQFLKSNNVIFPTSCDTKTHSDVFTIVNSIQAFLSCPCTSMKEISLLFN